MQLVYQTVYTDHEKQIVGNCLAACVATLLGYDLEALPVGCTMRSYLESFRQRGYEIKQVEGEPPHDDNVYVTSFEVAPCHNPQGIGHAVLTKNGKIIHDPSPRKLKLTRIRAYYDHLSKAA